MNLIQKHLNENQKQGKQALIRTATMLAEKHAKLTAELCKRLASGGTNECLVCTTNKFTKEMAKVDAQITQIVNTYEVLFDEDMDRKGMGEAAARKYFPMLFSENGEDFEGFSPEDRAEGIFDAGEIPEDAPQQIKDIAKAIKDALSKNGDVPGMSMHIVDMGKSKGGKIYGLKPDDYPSFPEFMDAVGKARKAGVPRHADISGEEQIKENVIANTEAAIQHADEVGKLPKSKRASAKIEEQKRKDRLN